MSFVRKEDIKDNVSGYKDYKSFLDSLGEDKNQLFILSITHRSLVDEVLESINPFIKKGDIIINGGNEWYLNSETRQKELREKGVGYVGMGVSGGYQSARRGPSMSPGGDDHILDRVVPILKTFAARYQGNPCVTKIGPGGSGHYVKCMYITVSSNAIGSERILGNPVQVSPHRSR